MVNGEKLRIAVLASGGGTNLQSIIDACNAETINAEVAIVICNKKNAFALKRAENNGIPAFYVSKKTEKSMKAVDEKLIFLFKKYEIELICLAGYLKKISAKIIEEFPEKIINIHPGLLPFLGGKGLYGLRVHEKVIEYGMKVSGVTIHFVDDKYDHGPIIAQKCVPVLYNDNPETLAKRVLTVEHSLYPMVIDGFAQKKIRCNGRKVIFDA